MIKLLKDTTYLSPKVLLLIFISMAIIIITSASIEISQSRNEFLQLMEAQSHSLLESLMINSRASLSANEEIEKQLRKRLLNNANLIKTFYEEDRLTDRLIKKLAEENELHRINVFNNDGVKIFSNHHNPNQNENNKYAEEFLYPLFTDEIDTLIITNKKARYNDGRRFVVALATKDNSVIVLNLNAEKLLNFQKELGFGILLQKLTEMDNIKYIALQDSNAILAASGKFQNLEAIEQSEFLIDRYTKSSFGWRLLEKEETYFEAVHTFTYKNEIIGLFRLGLSTEPLDLINEKVIRRMIIISLILIVLGSVILIVVFANQNFALLQKRFKVIDSYSKKIIDNASDAIILTSSSNNIKLYNQAAIKLFGVEKCKEDNDLSRLIDIDINEAPLNIPINIIIGGINKYILISKNQFTDENEENNFVYLFRDLTEIQRLQNKNIQNEKLAAMGQLASGVAHEIRNPLNSISTISQQLAKDFSPKEYEEEYGLLTNIIINEVKRIDQTVKSFLQFAKPEPISIAEFSLSDFVNELEFQFQKYLIDKDVNLTIKNNFKLNVFWDKNKIKQVFINLLENSIDAFESNGNINIDIEEQEKNIVIKFSDDGKGISEEKIKNIFDMYFTTKAKGTGVGLSIIQRIVYEHEGLIEVNSSEGKGTTFIISLPIKTRIKNG